MKTILAALALATPLALTSCEGTLDDVFGEWDKPTGGAVTPSDGGASTINATSLSITETTLRLDKSAPTPQALTLNVDPADATVTWESKDETVATVDASGKVTPIKAGKVTITAKSGDLDATSTVYVYDKIYDISTGAPTVTAGESWLIVGDGTAMANSITIPNSADNTKVTLKDINITTSIICYGNTTLILADGSTNMVDNSGDADNAAIAIVGASRSLTIEAETAGTGKLTAKGGSGAAGIGTDHASDAFCGNITINGGTVTAIGGTNAAGIGTGWSYAVTTNTSQTCGNITINGGTITAAGGDNAAGIGTGFAHNNTGTASQTCGDITIGADVTSVTATKGNDILGTVASYSIGTGRASTNTQTCGTIKFGSQPMYSGTSWTTTPTNGNTYGGLSFAISGINIPNDTWALTPAP